MVTFPHRCIIAVILAVVMLIFPCKGIIGLVMSVVMVTFPHRGIIGLILALATIVWCSYGASKLFVTALSMDDQQLLVAYPCALVYGIFVLLTVF